MASDEQLVGQVAAGSEAALAELLRRYERPLASFLFRHTGGRDVDDLFQEAWIRVVQNATRFDRERRFSTWLFQIAINLCRDWHRRDRPASELGEAADHTDWLVRIEDRVDTARLLARLPEPQREVLLLRYFSDLTEREVAEALGCPVGTVKSRMHNALAQLNAWAGKSSGRRE
jgi:RNA polymerase sigma-70 factor (ECF subfamily)